MSKTVLNYIKDFKEHFGVDGHMQNGFFYSNKNRQKTYIIDIVFDTSNNQFMLIPSSILSQLPLG